MIRVLVLLLVPMLAMALERTTSAGYVAASGVISGTGFAPIAVLRGARPAKQDFREGSDARTGAMDLSEGSTIGALPREVER